MADTYTSSLGVILMGIGGDNNTWGTNLNNSVFQIFEDSIANTLTTTASGGQLGPSNTLDLSANPPPAGPSAARYAALVEQTNAEGDLLYRGAAFDTYVHDE